MLNHTTKGVLTSQCTQLYHTKNNTSLSQKSKNSLNKKLRIGLGTVQFGLPYGISNKIGQPDKQEVIEVLKTARFLGISLLDTASAYGTAELLLGEIGTTGFR